MGRAKIGPLVRAEGFAASATVGRILASLVARGVVEAVPALRRRPYARRWTAKRRFAKRLPCELSVGEPGSLVQLDTVFVNLTPTKAIKHFTAYDPVAKWTVGKAFNRATAQAAASFLDKIIADMPFPVKAIQVDGGSEFMAEFEAACQAKGVALYVLPPRRPQMNGAVERCNGAWRYEFYETYDLPTGVEKLNPILDSFQHLYNHHRPTALLPEAPQPSISPTAQPKDPTRLISAEPGQSVDWRLAGGYGCRVEQPQSCNVIQYIRKFYGDMRRGADGISESPASLFFKQSENDPP